MHDVLERFVKARLLTSRGEEGERLLDVSHEALFRSWGRLRGWLEESRDDLRVERRLAEDAREWQERTETDRHAYLYRGARLEKANTWSRDRSW